MNNKNAKDILQANQALHSAISEKYNLLEPHYRNENVERVKTFIKNIQESTKGTKLLDLGCGTGFIIDIAKNYFDEIVGVDATASMIEKVNKNGKANIETIVSDTGSIKLDKGTFDVVTAYSFLHHLYDLESTLENASLALKNNGIFYADLDPNFYFWDSLLNISQTSEEYSSSIKRELNSVISSQRDADKYGISVDTLKLAEWGKDILGGFKAEEMEISLRKLGFKEIKFYYSWFVGQANLINSENADKDTLLAQATVVHNTLIEALPLSRNLFKYIGFIAIKS